MDEWSEEVLRRDEQSFWGLLGLRLILLTNPW